MKQHLPQWLRIGMLSFGGPAAQISVMHRIAVEEQRWVSEAEFLRALNFCMLLPGPEAQQMAVWLGWRTHGVRGGLISGALFVLPGSLIMLLLSWVYAQTQGLPAMLGLLLGLKCAVLSIVLQAVFRLARRVLKSRFLRFIAVLSGLLSVLKLLPFPLLILAAATLGLIQNRKMPATGLHSTAGNQGSEIPADSPLLNETRRFSLTLGTGMLLWWLPVICCGLLAGWSSLWVQLGVFFSQAAVLTFGGAYSVLNYVSAAVVDNFGWLTRAEMADGLGLAETTPGPLILVVQHVGFLSAWKQPGTLAPGMAGTFAAALTTWVTFVPSFLWILLGAPWLSRLNQLGWLAAIMSSVSAAAVGLIAALGAGLAGNTLFSGGFELQWGQFSLSIPDPRLLQPAAVLLTALSLTLTFAFRRGLAIILVSCALSGWLLSLFS